MALGHALILLALIHLSSSITLQVKTRVLPYHPYTRPIYSPQVSLSSDRAISDLPSIELQSDIPTILSKAETLESMNAIIAEKKEKSVDISKTGKRIAVSASLSVLTIVVLCYLFQVVAICVSN